MTNIISTVESRITMNTNLFLISQLTFLLSETASQDKRWWIDRTVSCYRPDHVTL